MSSPDSAVGSLFSWLDQAGTTHVLDVDVVMNTSDKRSAKLTDHVVETGAVITDHVIILPETLSLDLIVSQTPLSGPGMALTPGTIDAAGQSLQAKTYPLKIPPNQFQPGGFLLLSTGLRSAVSSLTNALLGTGGAGSTMQGSETKQTSSSVKISTLQAPDSTDRVNDVFDQLIDIINNALLVTVSFKGRLYVDYLLTEVSLESKAGYFGAGHFKVEARAFRTVTGVDVALPDPSDFRALAKKKAGNKSTTTPNPDPTKLPTSIAERNVAGDFLGLSSEPL